MVINGSQGLIEAIKLLSIVETLKYLAEKGITDFLKPGYEKIAQIIRDKGNVKKYAFVPNKSEAIKLQKAGEQPSYQELRLLVPSYKHLDLIRTGLLVLDYSKDPTTENKERIAFIKKQIIKRPGGNRLIKIVNLPSTNFFSSIMKYLHELKINGYPEHHIESEFEEFVHDWRESSLFVHNFDLVDDIVIFCHSQAKKQSDRFFILATQDTAVSLVEDALAYLTKEDFFRKNFYKFSVSRDPEVVRIEVIVTRKDLL